MSEEIAPYGLRLSEIPPSASKRLASLSLRLHRLADEMRSVSADLDECNAVDVAFSTHATELSGAAGTVENWAENISNILEQ